MMIIRTIVLLLTTLSFQYTFANDELAEGGRIYDKWWAELELKKPQGTHVGYSPGGKKSGADTWRCKECHGWDYRGKEGAYSKGSHYSGITGIRKYAGGDVKEVMKILKNKHHQFDTVMFDGALMLVAKFVVNGQVDMQKYIDDKNKQVNGNIRRGKKHFENNCARCHSDDGRAMNLAHDADKVEYVGSVAAKNPWETLHKIRNGHPGSRMSMHRGRRMGMMHNRYGGWEMNEAMPAMLSELSEQEQIDLLAYTQTLPKK
ncbi:MAG: cytochrome c [Gammaproteobacteria bacterium]|nr:cytochrome c [Gammaproteobacteria bacterium]